MWSSSSFLTSGTSSSSESLHTIAQYIEDYMDLVENVPNDIARQITQLHEHNHRYHQLLAQLESSLDVACGKTSATDMKKRNAMLKIQRFLIEIQEIADEKLLLIQSILDQLDSKARQLEHDYRSATMSSGSSSSLVSSRALAHSLSIGSGSGNSISTNQSSSQRSEVTNTAVTNTSAHNISANVNDHHVTSAKDSNAVANSGAGSSGNGHTIVAAAVSSSSTSGGKRASSRRQISGRGNHDNGEGGKKSVKRGVKGSTRELKRSKSHGGILSSSSSPPPLYEGAPIDPDEPTYCLCEQVSYGEMICCDNSACPIEWFHFSCVSLNTKPKGKWYCPNCRGERSNIPKK